MMKYEKANLGMNNSRYGASAFQVYGNNNRSRAVAMSASTDAAPTVSGDTKIDVIDDF